MPAGGVKVSVTGSESGVPEGAMRYPLPTPPSRPTGTISAMVNVTAADSAPAGTVMVSAPAEAVRLSEPPAGPMTTLETSPAGFPLGGGAGPPGRQGPP